MKNIENKIRIKESKITKKRRNIYIYVFFFYLYKNYI